MSDPTDDPEKLLALLKEAHWLLAAVLLRAGIGLDITQGPLHDRIVQWDATLKAERIVNVDRKRPDPEPGQQG